MNTIKKSDLMQFLTEKKQMMVGGKSANNPVIAPPKPKTKPNTPVTPKHPKPAVNPKPKASKGESEPFVIPTKPKTKPNTPTTPKPAVNPKPKANIGEGEKMSKKVKINKKYPRKFVKEHINSYFSVDIVNETIGDDYSVELQLIGNKSELIKCLKNLKEGNVIN